MEKDLAHWQLTLLGEQTALTCAVRALIRSHPAPQAALAAWNIERLSRLELDANEMDGGSVQVDATRALLSWLDADFTAAARPKS